MRIVARNISKYPAGIPCIPRNLNLLDKVDTCNFGGTVPSSSVMDSEYPGEIIAWDLGPHFGRDAGWFQALRSWWGASVSGERKG